MPVDEVKCADFDVENKGNHLLSRQLIERLGRAFSIDVVEYSSPCDSRTPNKKSYRKKTLFFGTKVIANRSSKIEGSSFSF